MFLGFVNRKNSSNQKNEIELSDKVIHTPTTSTNNSNLLNEHIYEEILDYYDKDIQLVNESATLSSHRNKKCVRFKSNNHHQSGQFTDVSTLPSTSSTSILMPILRIDPLLVKNNNHTNTMFSLSISSTSSASSSSSSSSSSCIYTTSSLLSNTSSNHSIVFNQMVEDFLNHCTLKLTKTNNKQNDNSFQVNSNSLSKLKLNKKKKKSVLNTSCNSSTSTMSSNSSTNINSSSTTDYKCCCQQQPTHKSNTLDSEQLDKLSYRVTNLTLDDLKKRQKLIYNHQRSMNSNNLFNNNTVKQF